ncbi:FAD-dependent monooxygenase [Caballeronia sp. BR00000012568055]|uniref:FAD-dependent monooxygenase n=1 Tax=Caballeronia sp. BR00000012568055 TaxID=2918761 RepID=UPI0023F70427|nr:FAD-dependent monooxygenase [Caballeronia sp. BR00000012568055]
MDRSLSVLIVGAGPTGLTLALTLRRHGIAARVIDKLPETANLSKALAVWPASLEVLSGLGVGAEFANASVPLKAVVFGDGTERLARISMEDGIDSAHPQPILLPQSQTEGILAARYTQMGGVVQRGVELTGLVEQADTVDVTLRHADGRIETTNAAWVIGADGAKSAVRHALGIEFEGDTEHEGYWLGDVHIDGAELDAHSIHIWWHDGGTVALFPFEDGVWRVISRRHVDKAHEQNDDPPTLDQLQEQMTRHGPPGGRLSEPGWLSTFRINERLAARFRGSARVFLAGDAAHIHSPAGGQGMNTGIQDAANLGWKLAYVLQGRGHQATLLDSYEAERRPVARDVIANATRMLHVGMAPHPVARVVRDAAVRLIDHMPALQARLRTEMSETDITYHDGPLVALGETSRHPSRGHTGTRALDIRWTDRSGEEHSLWPLLSERHTLLAFGDGVVSRAVECVAPYEDAVATVTLGSSLDMDHAARHRYGFDDAGWVLIRPDQVIALRGTDADITALERYLAMVIAPGAM